ncbi:MAG: type I polyketide synthase [bacterium]|nr:type I polyketide synthase [bacterium]
MSELSNQISELSPLKLALLARSIREKVDGIEYVGVEPIAIVGAGCRMPGGARDPESFWKMMLDGVDAVREVPASKWNAEEYYDANKDAAGKIYTKFGAFLDADEIEQFDAGFFGISPNEAKSMDPQQRMVLEVAFEALENAGIPVESLAGSRTGVFMGVGQNDYADLELKAADHTGINAYTGTGLLFSAISGRISYAFGLQGPSVVKDGACSSSLMTVHEACQSLRSGESELALAGGVHLIVTPNMTVWLSRSTAISPDGRCKTFSASADGYSRGEGCGIVVLKRLSDALRDGDNIMALVRGSAVNHGGASQGFTVPNGIAQQSLIRTALEDSGVRPDQVSYIEAHGTGTALGDPIEVNALNAVFGKNRDRNNKMYLGSVKTNVGHLETAAGIAGLIKVALSLKHKTLPPHLHFKRAEVNPHIDLSVIPAEVPESETEWKAPGGRLIAGVSSFGITGQNAHVILEEAPELPQKAAQKSTPEAAPHLLTLSARSPEALAQVATEYEDLFRRGESTPYDICYNASLRRSHHDHRFTIVADSAQAFAEKLGQVASGETGEGVTPPRKILKGKPQIAFVCSGQGPQWFKMGRQLIEREPVFRAKIEEIAGMLDQHADWSLLDELNKSEAESRIMDTEIGQPAIFALQVALAELWKSRGIVPDGVVGHSVGEVAAAHISGVLTLTDAVFVIYHRARLMQQATGLGKMAAVEMPADKLKPYVKDYAGRLELGAVNGPSSCVLSGEEAALNEVLAKLAESKVFTKLLPVNYAFHSPQMEPFKKELTKTLGQIKTRPATITAYSTVSGKLAGKSDYDAAYWGRNIREPVVFAPAIEAMAQDGFNAFLELSAHPVLANYVAMCLEQAGKTEAGVTSSLNRKVDESAAMLQAAGTLHALGCGIQFKALYPERGRHLRLPNYPWQHQRYWIDAPAIKPGVAQNVASGDHYFLGSRIESPLNIIQFESVFTDEMPYTFKDHVLYGEIVVPGASHLSMCLSGARKAFGNQKFTIIDSFFHQALVLRKDDARYVQLIFEPQDGDAEYSWSVHSRDATGLGRDEWVLHATGKLEVSEGENPDTRIDPQEMLKAYPKHFNREEFYKFFYDCGYNLTDTFRWADECWWKEGEAFILMTAPDGVYDADKYVLFPSLIDAQYQAGTTAYPKEAPDANDEGGLAYHVDAEHIYVPWNNRRIEWYGNYDTTKFDGTKFWSHIRLKDTRDTVKKGQEVFRGDLDLYDPDGKLVATFHDWALKRVSGESLLKLIRGGGDWLHELTWKQSALRGKRAPGEKTARWLIFADRSGSGENLAKTLRAAGKECVTVFAGSAFEKSGDDSFTIDPHKQADFEKVLAESFSGEVTSIAYLWGIDATPTEGSTIESLQTDERTITGGLLNLGVGMNQIQWKNFPSLRLVTRGAQAANESEGSQLSAVAASIWGMGRVIALENPDVWRGCIDLDPVAFEAESEVLGKELLADGAEDHVLLRKSNRYIADLAPHSAKTPEEPVAFKADASYLITGGLGGLGLELAEYMAQNGAGHLGLIGRRAPSEEVLKRLAEIEKSTGAKLVPMQGDISLAADVERIFKEADAKLPAVKGLVHSAGVLEDGILTQQTWERYAKVLAPKVEGSWNLHQATRQRELDFFVMFSSVSALTGSPGQSNYAAANAFMDGLAVYRRANGLPAVSIAWGPWADVGMAANISADAAKRGWRAEGLGSIDLQGGMQAFAQLTAMDTASAAVMPFRWPKLFEQFPVMAKQTMFASLAKRHYTADVEPGAGGSDIVQKIKSAPAEEQMELLNGFIKDQIAKVLGFDPAAPIDPQKGFFDLGGDSLSSVQLRNVLQTALDKSLPTTMIFDYPSVETIAAYLAADVLELSAATQDESGQTDADAAEQMRQQIADEVEQMSDDEAEAELLRELAGLD